MKNKKIAIKFRTIEEAEEIVKSIEKIDNIYKSNLWLSRVSSLRIDKYNCISPGSFDGKYSWDYCDLSYYIKNKYKIIPAKKFLGKSVPKKVKNNQRKIYW
jgi:hypothetical protein